MKILFVCTGNTCRSPMAEALLNEMASGIHTAISSGTNVFMPQRVSSKSVEALKKLGISDFSHISRMITEEDAANSDLILTMTSSHKFAVKNTFPKFKNKVYTLKEKAYGLESDIADPYGLGQDEYDKCAKKIKEAIEKLLCIL